MGRWTGSSVVGAWSDFHPDIPTPSRSLCLYRHCGRRNVINFCLGHFIFGVVTSTAYVVLPHGLPVSAAR